MKTVKGACPAYMSWSFKYSVRASVRRISLSHCKWLAASDSCPRLRASICNSLGDQMEIWSVSGGAFGAPAEATPWSSEEVARIQASITAAKNANPSVDAKVGLGGGLGLLCAWCHQL
jgi:hypothetical protein